MAEEDVGLPTSTNDGIVSNEHNQDICLKRTSNNTTIASCPDGSEEPGVSLRVESNSVSTNGNTHSKTDHQSTQPGTAKIFLKWSWVGS